MPGVLLGLAVLVGASSPSSLSRSSSASSQGARAPSYARDGALVLRPVAPPADAPRLWTLTELRLDLGATYANPFDPAQIRVDARIETPSGRVYVQPGFFARQYARGLEGTKETLTPDGEGYWAVRFTPAEPGAHRITVTAQDRSGTATAPPLTLGAVAPAGTVPLAGFVGVSRADRRYFETSVGASFWPIGANLAWAGEGGTRDYDRWLPKYAEQGANLVRLWLAPGGTTFGLERGGLGYGAFDLEAAWRLDRVLAEARARGIRAQLCLDSSDALDNRAQDNRAPDTRAGTKGWAGAAANRRNGGPLDYPGQVWTDPTAERVALARLRYVVARYGADPAVFAWELWDEADRTPEFPVAAARAWHAKMASALRALDPYGHPITTSFANPGGVKEIDLLGELDFLQTHATVPGDVVNPVAVQQSRKGGWGKPHLLARIGADERGPNPKDVRGYELHDPMWCAVGTASSGSAMAWWWDSGTEAKGLYPLYGALARFVEGIDFPREGFRQTRAGFGYLERNATAPKAPALDAWAAVGERTVVLWARNSGHSFARLMAEGESAGGTIPPTYVKLAGLASGTYDVTLWDTWAGHPIKTIERSVGLDGILTVALPAITHDLALKAVLRP